MYKYSWGEYSKAVAEYFYSEVNDSQKEIDRYRAIVDKVVSQSEMFHCNRHRNTWRDLIHGEWQWWRPLVHKRIMKHYNKYIVGDK